MVYRHNISAPFPHMCRAASPIVKMLCARPESPVRIVGNITHWTFFGGVIIGVVVSRYRGVVTGEAAQIIMGGVVGNQQMMLLSRDAYDKTWARSSKLATAVVIVVAGE